MVEQATCPCLCIFSEVQDSQKILIFENEALQKAWAVLLIALENVLKAYHHPWYLNSETVSTDTAGTAN